MNIKQATESAGMTKPQPLRATELKNLLYRAIAKIEDADCLNTQETFDLVEDLETAAQELCDADTPQ